MASFSYTARNSEGMLVQATADASSIGAMAAELRRTGLTPIQIEPAAAEPIDVLQLLRREHISLDEMVFLCRQMYRLVKAGVPIIGAVSGLAGATKNPAMARVLRDVTESMSSGRDMATSLARHPRFFSSLFVGVVAIGENTGKLDEAFLNLAAHLELERETRRRIKTATRYPIMVGLALLGAMILINVVVIPTFAKMFESFGAELPLATRILIGASNLTISYWPHALIATACAVLSARQWVGTPEGRLTWDRLQLRVPVVGRILERAMLARYARSFSMTFGAGLPVIEALRGSARATDNRWLESRFDEMRQSIQRGQTFTRSAAHAEVFDPLILQMLTVGETTGALADAHQDIAETYESEVDYDLKRLTDLIEPLLIVGAGVVVFVLALGVYLPMWELSTAMRGGG